MQMSIDECDWWWLVRNISRGGNEYLESLNNKYIYGVRGLHLWLPKPIKTSHLISLSFDVVMSWWFSSVRTIAEDHITSSLPNIYSAPSTTPPHQKTQRETQITKLIAYDFRPLSIIHNTFKMPAIMMNSFSKASSRRVFRRGSSGYGPQRAVRVTTSSESSSRGSPSVNNSRHRRNPTLDFSGLQASFIPQSSFQEEDNWGHFVDFDPLRWSVQRLGSSQPDIILSQPFPSPPFLIMYIISFVKNCWIIIEYRLKLQCDYLVDLSLIF